MTVAKRRDEGIDAAKERGHCSIGVLLRFCKLGDSLGTQDGAPDRSAMGHLTFSELEITPLGPDAAVILGHWQLLREKDSPGGVFTLVARRLPEGWRIIHDHTSAFAAPS